MLVCTHQRRRMLNNANLNLYLAGKPIQQVDKIKILGVTIDENLLWKDHINDLCGRLSRILGLFWRIRSNLGTQSRIMYYNSYVQPVIDYCICVWGYASSSQLSKITKMLKRCARIILNCDMSTSSESMFMSLKWLPVNKRVLYNTCCHVYYHE